MNENLKNKKRLICPSLTLFLYLREYLFSYDYFILQIMVYGTRGN